MNNRIRIPMPLQILMMVAILTVGGVYLLLGQQAPSEESDWPWKVVTESKVFLNGAPAGKLSDPSPMTKKLGLLLDQGRRTGKFDQYDSAPVLLVADPDTAVDRIERLTFAIIEGSGDAILVKGSSLDKSWNSPKPNPRAMIVATGNVDANKAKRLANLPDSEFGSVGNRVYFLDEKNPDTLRFARTYESSIEIGSDGKFYFNEQTGRREGLTANLASRVANPMWEESNSNQPPRGNVKLPPVAPLKQQALPRAELEAAVGKLVSSADATNPMIYIIASEKARYESILQIMDAIGNPEVMLVITVRRIVTK